MTRRPRVLVALGTRPEVVKLAPVIHALRADARFETLVLATAQHREMLDRTLDALGIVPDLDLDVMRPGQTLEALTTRVLEGFALALREVRPDRVVVQGDTTTTFAAALAAFYARVPVAHVEAGLRTGDMAQPFPEEGNRRLVSALADLHLAPTPRARDALLREGIDPAAVHVTGNTVVDALLATRDRLAKGEAIPGVAETLALIAPHRAAGRRMILVTSHRRENFDRGIAGICEAVLGLAARPDAAILFPVHPNPNVRGPVEGRLGGHPRVTLCAPLDYGPFIAALGAAHLALTDSGGVQEEAPSLGVPALVLREATERPEGVEAGTARLVGADPARILREATRLLDDAGAHAAMARAHNPFGDGRAAPRIAAILAERHGMGA